MQKIKANNKERIETGALQVNDDWPGLFIRGDDCIALLRVLQDAIPRTPFGAGLSQLYDIRVGLGEVIRQIHTYPKQRQQEQRR